MQYIFHYFYRRATSSTNLENKRKINDLRCNFHILQVVCNFVLNGYLKYSHLVKETAICELSLIVYNHLLTDKFIK